MKYIITFIFICNCSIAFTQDSATQATNIYNKIYTQLCNCFAANKIEDSTKRKEYCYALVLNKNYSELKKYGVDTLVNKDFKRYYDLYLKRYAGKSSDMLHAQKDDYSQDNSFFGSLVKQEKKADNKYEITLKSRTSNTIRKFISDQAVDQNELKRFIEGEDNIIVSYQTIIDDGKEKYLIKSIVYIGTVKK